LKNIKMYGKFRQDLCEKFFEAEEAINWLDESTLNHKQATRHPTAEAHQIWADYLYFNFSNGLNKYYHARRD
jgi:hypothetical protein